MQSLETVKKIYKVLKAIMLAFAIVCFVGAGFCVLGGVIVLVANAMYGDEIASAVMDTVGQFDFGTLNDSIGLIGTSLVEMAGIVCFGGAIMAAASGVVFIFCHRYCKNFELENTPFSYRGAAELRKVGILSIAIPFGAQILVSAIFSALGIPTTFAGSSGGSIAMGVLLILLSFVFKYGADMLAASGMTTGGSEPSQLPPAQSENNSGNGPDLI